MKPRYRYLLVGVYDDPVEVGVHDLRPEPAQFADQAPEELGHQNVHQPEQQRVLQERVAVSAEVEIQRREQAVGHGVALDSKEEQQGMVLACQR